jgi:NOL1/NOP2/fmu family ribosome biogenesis protein
MEERFGMSRALFDPFLLLKRRRSWWLVRNQSYIRRAAPLKVERVGLKAFHQVGAYLKPTTRMIQIFGKEASRRRVELDRRGLLQLLDGKEIKSELAIEPGYVILGWEGNSILGMGLYIDGTIRSQIPRKELRRIHIS